MDTDGFEHELVTTTDKDGKFSFTGLKAGTYTLREVQPDLLNDGEDIVGTAGGTASHDAGSFEDVIEGIVLGAGQAATGYLFGELPGD
jgi:hypothetical protein